MPRFCGRVAREEIELMVSEIEATETSHNTEQLLSSQALLAIRWVHRTWKVIAELPPGFLELSMLKNG